MVEKGVVAKWTCWDHLYTLKFLMILLVGRVGLVIGLVCSKHWNGLHSLGEAECLLVGNAGVNAGCMEEGSYACSTD